MTQVIWKTTAVRSIKWIMIINHSELYHQVIKIQEINHWVQVWLNHDCCEQIYEKSIFHVISWENESEENHLFIWMTYYCKSWNINRNNFWQKHKIQIEILTNIDNIERDKNKDEYNWTFTNEWSDWMIQSDNEAILKMLCELSTEQLNRIVTCNTICI